MVFMGSTKYPDENYYDSFVTTHGMIGIVLVYGFF